MKSPEILKTIAGSNINATANKSKNISPKHEILPPEIKQTIVESHNSSVIKESLNISLNKASHVSNIMNCDNEDVVVPVAGSAKELEDCLEKPLATSFPKYIPDAPYDMVFLSKYHSGEIKLASQQAYKDGKVIRQYDNGKTELIFTNGVRKEIFPDSYSVIYFNNKDVKQLYPDGRVVYYFAGARTTQTAFADGLQVFKFATGQVEKHYPDGSKEISFPDGTLKCVLADGQEESVFADGTVQRVEKSGLKSVEYPSGEKEIVFPDGTMIKEFPDGRVKKTYRDGSYESTIVDPNCFIPYIIPNK
eukprot:TRINITY_DN11852_c0_g1_i1.p2 TRINITY_DN11852_c0_g1~~TRINITY_DN11852_c0_g1_i1.p2  ORF type:complete len:305 (+),score=72.94 TRINITY_DN11852_c0_g1_i1:172-1086(+)